MYEESFLLGADVRLYLEEEEFHHVYQQHARAKWLDRCEGNLTRSNEAVALSRIVQRSV